MGRKKRDLSTKSNCESNLSLQLRQEKAKPVTVDQCAKNAFELKRAIEIREEAAELGEVLLDVWEELD